MHCVTGWSRLDNLWEGVQALALKNLAKILPEARFAIVHACGGFITNLSLEDFFQEDVLLAVKHDGRSISPEHGYPARLVVPRLYFWKSAKWVTGIDYLFEKIASLLVIGMKSFTAILLLLTLILLSSGGQALRTFSGETVSIDTPVEDDVFAAGSIVNINAPVDSAVVTGGTISINAPVKGDVFALGGQVYINSDVGGKVVTAGGNVNLGGNIGTNLIAAGGQVNILPGRNVDKDALIAGGNVVNAGHVNGTLTVGANQFSNAGSAGRVEFHKVESRKEESRQVREEFSFFGLLIILGYFILGLILVRYLPGIFMAVDREARSSPVLKTIVGFVLIIASFIAFLLLALTVVGLPIALISSLLIIAALALTGTFLSYSLGKEIGERLKLKQGDLVLFVIGFVILNVLFLLPYVGWLISLISVCLGFAAILYAARHLAKAGEAKPA